jgi:hypothetical protein
MADMDMGGSPFMPQPTQVKAFKGETALTTALLELVEGKPQKLYVTSGHGEAELKSGQPQNPDDGVIVAEYFKRSNIKYEPLRLLDVERVPEDATALLVFGPKQDLSDREIELLDNYWNNKGRVFVLLNGPAKTPRLNAWLAKSGVTPGGGRLVRTVQMLNLRSGQRETRVAASAEGKFWRPARILLKISPGMMRSSLGLALRSTSIRQRPRRSSCASRSWLKWGRTSGPSWTPLPALQCRRVIPTAKRKGHSRLPLRSKKVRSRG